MEFKSLADFVKAGIDETLKVKLQEWKLEK